jgi:hypothetical protein
MRETVAADRAVDGARQSSPSAAADYQQVTWLVGSADQRWAWCTPHDEGMNQQSVRNAAERVVKGGAQAAAGSVLPVAEQDRARRAPVGDLATDRRPGEQRQQFCSG